MKSTDSLVQKEYRFEIDEDGFVLMTQASRIKNNPDNLVRENYPLDRDFGIKYSQYKDIYDAFNEAIRNVGEANNILVIDLARTVPQENDYMYDAVHFNDNGSIFVAKIIANELLRYNLLK